MTPELSAVVLCYGGEENIRPFVSELRKSLSTAGIERYEIILVANYFPRTDDRTREIACQLAQDDPSMVVVARPKQGMMGWDALAGLRHATGATVALIDGDGQIPAGSVVEAFRAFKRSKVDFVASYRARRHDGWRRRFLSKAFNLLFSALFPGTRLRDINSKPKLFSRDAFSRMRLTSSGWFLDGEMALEARRLGLTFEEIPVVFERNRFRASFINMAAVFEVLGMLIACRTRLLGDVTPKRKIPFEQVQRR